jgi:hypothetical protein
MKGQSKSKKGSRPINCLNRNLIVLLPPGSNTIYHDTWGWRERRRREIRCMHVSMWHYIYIYTLQIFVYVQFYSFICLCPILFFYSFQTKRIKLDINKDLKCISVYISLKHFMAEISLKHFISV